MKPYLNRSPSYLVRNPYSYCFRMRVPIDLQAYIGKKELRYSLKTGYLSTAKQKSRIIAGQVQFLFKHIRNANHMTKDLSDTQIQDIINQYLREYIDGLESRYYDDESFLSDRKDFYSYVDDLDSIKQDIQVCLGTGDYYTVEAIADDYLKKNKIAGIAKGSPSYITMAGITKR